jgi:prepilin-type N-terminal cleavage/methylation domain-containing protein
MKNDPATRSGFTLIEILVVLSVLAALIVVMSPVLFSTKAQGERAATQADIQGLKAALQNRMTDPKIGDVPPTSLSEAGFESTNDLNEGIEVLVATLGAEGSALNPFEDEDKLINHDGDKDPRRTTFQQSHELFEYADAWGNPLIYFRLRDFTNNPEGKVRYQTVSGEVIEVGPVRSKKTGSFAGVADGYQIISLGPDEEFGTDDDVRSWTSR